MTTNAGSGRSASALGFTTSESHAEKNRIEKALLEFLRPEFINRVDEVIVFNSLTENDFCNIVKIMLGDLITVLSDRNITMTYTDNAAKLIADESYSVKYGARNMRRYIQRNIEDVIAEHIISDIYGKISTVNVSVKSGLLHVECK
jgi:ATP-dependent Clp protease ATP-binding subunit ClpB